MVHMSLDFITKWLELLFCIQRILIQISSQRPVILPEDFYILISSYMKIPEQYLILYNECWFQIQ